MFNHFYLKIMKIINYSYLEANWFGKNDNVLSIFKMNLKPSQFNTNALRGPSYQMWNIGDQINGLIS